MKKARILIAQDARALGLTAKALSAYEIVPVKNLAAAKYQVIEDGIDLFVIGIHFDDSRAMDLIRIIRTDSKHRESPIIVVRFLPTLVCHTLKAITNALIKVGVINHYLELEGDQNADLKIRDAVEACLPMEKTSAKRETRGSNPTSP